MNKDPLVDKIPAFNSFKIAPIHVIAYILLLYFVYKEFTQSNNCKQLEVIVAEYKIMNENLSERVRTLEKSIDVKNGVISEVTLELESKKGMK